MPPAILQDPALGRVLDALPHARLVGGAVRDVLAGRPVADMDLATPDRPEQVIAALDAAGLRHKPTGLAHGTVMALVHGQGLEITTLRRDEHTDGRHASVSWTDSWQEDAARRDFTINAMSMERDGTLHDYFGGQDDLRAGRLRFVGEPAARIAEDYLRILRFFRFYGRYARNTPDDGTALALAEGVPGLARLSPERVWSELKRILTLKRPVRTVRLMQRLGVLDAVLPGGTDPAALERLVEDGAPADPLLRLAALHPAVLEPGAGVVERLRLSKAEAKVLDGLAGPAPDPTWDDDDIRRVLADTDAAHLVGRAWLHNAGRILVPRLLAQPRPVFALAGRDVVALGVPHGPEVGRLLAAVRAWWLAGGCRADPAACRAELARLAAA